MRRLAVLLVFGLAACGAPSAEELADSMLPLTEAHELLEDYQFQIEAGLSYQRFIDSWPARSAEIRQALNRFNSEGLPEDDVVDMELYADWLELTHNILDGLPTAIRGYLDGITDESFISVGMELANVSLGRMNEFRDKALTPGRQTPLD